MDSPNENNTELRKVPIAISFWVLGFILGESVIKWKWDPNWVTAICTLGLVIVGALALTSIRISQNDIKTRENRASVTLAIQQIEFYREKIIPQINLLYGYRYGLGPITRESNLKLSKWKKDLNDLTFEEVALGVSDMRADFESDLDTITSDANYSFIIRETANMFESFAVAFDKEAADQKAAINAVGKSLCDFVTTYLALYCNNRRNGKIYYYHSTIKLYKMWLPELERIELS